MACHFSFSTSPFWQIQKPHKVSPRLRLYSSITCQNQNPDFENDAKFKESETSRKTSRTHLDFLALPITLTVISTSLSTQPAVAAPSAAKTKRTQKRTKQEAWTPEQLGQWTKDLPVVSNRIPYTDILRFKESNKLKHVVKAPGASLKERQEAVLVVLDDNQVYRTVLPSLDSNLRFWDSWDGLKIDALCVNAFTPPVKKPELPKPYLGFFWKVPEFMLSKFKPKKGTSRAKELRRVREQMIREVREEQEMYYKEYKLQKKQEERSRRAETRRKKYEMSLRHSQQTYARLGSYWYSIARNKQTSNVLGMLFLLIFYQTVVVSYKKQRKDYEDRLKIEMEEEEEKRKIRELERDMVGYEGGGDEKGKGDKNPYLKMAKEFMKSGARVKRAQNKRVPQYLERGLDVKFSDVAGLGKLRLELEEVVKFFTHGDIYRRRGVKIPGGILLCGPPGVGKTLLAKAVAGEAGVNFFSISASQFVEIYVGVGASRVRSLYQEAKENAPSVVFIDELDAVGRKRGLIKGSGGQERDATLNQLLVCLDGFDGKGEVITIASTNRPDILDPALVRPGRFDRKIHIPRPSLKGRAEILQVHARKKPMAGDVDYMAVASATDGMVGAELANIIEIAAINMMRDDRKEITTDYLLQAAIIEERGTLVKKQRSPETWKRIAIHEASIIVAAVNFPDYKNIEFATIYPRAGRELGYNRLNLDEYKFGTGTYSGQNVLEWITILLAPRAAEELLYGEDQLSTLSSAATNDARSIARDYVLGGIPYKHHGLFHYWLPERINDIDELALQFVHMCYESSKEVMQQNMKLLEVLAKELLEKQELEKEDISRIVETHGCLKTPPPSLLELRAAKNVEFQELLANRKEAITQSSI